MPFINEVSNSCGEHGRFGSHFIGNNVFGEGLNFVPPTRMTIQYALQGIGTRDDIDKTLKLGMNHPMGPLQLGKYLTSKLDAMTDM